ncbi:PorP/SprF family type IX secretion system membrane protein [Pseudochryseolinea flava]|nr:type IX secretion system membrane protein PorP/SprF [Pseudochryseolinea flava]
MFRYIVLALLVLGLHPLHAQFMPNTGQSFQFASGFNPAFSGVESQSDLKLGYRYQWAGFGDAAPRFINLGFNTRLKQPVDLITHSLRMSNAKDLNSAAFIPARKRTIHGLGANFFYEKTGGYFVRTGGAVHYAFHYPLSPQLRLSVGGSALIESTKYDDLYLGKDADPDELAGKYAGQGELYFNTRLGFLLYGKNFYFGATYMDLFDKVITTPSEETSASAAMYKGSAQAGVSFEVAPAVFIRPSLLAIMNFQNKLSFDFNVKAYIQEKVWFGFTFRDAQSPIGSNKSLLGLLGFNVNKTFAAAYSYERSIGGMSKFHDGSHELVLAIRFNNLKRPGPTIW